MAKWHDRVQKMLDPLKEVCANCGMCSLGRAKHQAQGREFDPHVFSNMTPSKFVVVGQNPGFNECMISQPFVGAAGENFNKEIAKHDVSRDDLYITNAAKCHTPANRAPNSEEVSSCEPFLRMEFGLLQPKLVVTLGAVAFGLLCEGKFSDSLGSIVESEWFGVKVFPVYHPSPRNMNLKARRERFEHDIEVLCKLIKKLKEDIEGGSVR